MPIVDLTRVAVKTVKESGDVEQLMTGVHEVKVLDVDLVEHEAS